MLHVTTEVGKVGKAERERRHFPIIHNNRTSGTYSSQGRRYIAHGSGVYNEPGFHPQHVEPEYTEVGPDWSSRIRWLPHPENPRYPAEELWPVKWYSIRRFPYTYMRTDKEWALVPDDGAKPGIRCSFDGVHKATEISTAELSDAIRFGKGKQVFEKRNGLSNAAYGDKNYQVPEFAPKFHNFGSTRAVINFGGQQKLSRANTLASLKSSNHGKKENFKQKEFDRQRREDAKVVANLETWRPATPLQVKVDDKKDKW